MVNLIYYKIDSVGICVMVVYEMIKIILANFWYNFLLVLPTEFPLYRRQNSQSTRKKKQGLKGPLRVLRLCLLGILVPCVLSISILYMRYRVYVEQLYPLTISDMRMLDSRISTTWCQVSY